MANRLSMFANLVAFAEDRGCRIINPTFHSYSHHFANLSRNFYCAYPVPNRMSLFDRVPFAGDAVRSVRGLHHLTRTTTAIIRRGIIPGAVVADKFRAEDWPAPLAPSRSDSDIGNASVVFLRDWRFRVPDLVMRHAPAVRSFLRPVESVEARSSAAVHDLRKKADLVIGVHIRHGDYETFKGGRYFFTPERYAAWMHDLAEAQAPRRAAFLVCSDGTFERRAFGDLTVGYGPGDSYGDVFALSECDMLIGPLSTYTQWASYYGKVPLYHLRGSDDQPASGRFVVSDLSEIP